MRIYRNLFFQFANIDNSNFFVFYSNGSVLSGKFQKIPGTDGSSVRDLLLDVSSIKEGVFKAIEKGYEVKIEENVEIWEATKVNHYKSRDNTIINISDTNMMDTFMAHNQNLLIDLKPVQHDYIKLDRKDDYFKKYFIVNWFLGNTCSFACSYCPSYLHDGSIPWMNLDILKNFIDKVFSEKKGRTIVFEFTGGEVTLYKHFGELCEYIKSKGDCIITLISNGSRQMDWWSKNVKNIDVVLLSFHTEFADRSNFVKLVHFLNDKVDLTVNIMVPPGKLDYCMEVGKELRDHKNINALLKILIEDLEGEMLEGYTEKDISEINLFNLGIDERVYNNVGKSVYKSMMVKVLDTREKKIVKPFELIENKENTWFGWNCYSGIDQIAINAEGDINRGWCLVGGKIGNITSPDIKFPNIPVLCNKELCHCEFDMYSIKEPI